MCNYNNNENTNKKLTYLPGTKKRLSCGVVMGSVRQKPSAHSIYIHCIYLNSC